MIRTLPLLAGLAACGGDKDASGADDSSPAPITCPSYSGYGAVGAVWTYDDVSEDYTGQTEVRFVSMDDDVITVTRQEDGGGADYTYTASYTETWRCGAGLVPLTARQDYTTNGSGGEYVGWGEIQFEATGPTLPDTLAVGATWDISVTLTATSETTGDGEPTVNDVTHHFEVVSEADVVVPAGTYTALQVADTVNGTRTLVSWWSDGVGMVESDTLSLTSFAPGD